MSHLSTLLRQGLSHCKTGANALTVTAWKHIQAECCFRHKMVTLVTYIFSAKEKKNPPVFVTLLIYTKPKGPNKRLN